MTVRRLGAERVQNSERPPLRAIRREPLLLDDQAVAARLDVGVEPEVARWARAWLVCWLAALANDERYGRVDPWEIATPLDAVATPKGGGDAARRRAVLDVLAARGVVRIDDVSAGRRTVAVVTVARDLFTEHPAALAVDWATVVARCGVEPAALLVMRALAELLVPLDGWSSVPRRELIRHTRYQQKQVRAAVRRLVAADLLLAEGDAGTTARYRLSARALGRHWPAVDAAPELVDVETPRPVTAIAATAATAASATTATAEAPGVEVVVGGATVMIAAGASFAIGAGLAARLELGPDGRPRLVVDPSA